MITFNIMGPREKINMLFDGELKSVVIIDEWFEREPNADLNVRVPDEYADALCDDCEAIGIKCEMV